MDISRLYRVFIVSVLLLIVLIPQPLFEKNISFIICFLVLVFLSSAPNIIKNIDRVDILMLAFIGIVFLEALWSHDIKTALSRYVLSYLPLLFIYLIVKNQDKSSYSFMLKSLVFIGFASSIFTIFEFFSGQNFIYEHVLQGNYYYNTGAYKDRAFGIFYHPTITGSFFTICLPFVYLFMDEKKKGIIRYLGYIAFISISFAIIFTFSKMAWIIMLCIYVWYFRKKEAIINKLQMVAFLILMPVIFLKSNVFIYKLTMEWPLDIRLRSIYVAKEMIKDHPFAGVGLGHFRLLYQNYVTGAVDSALKTPDNMYLMILTEAGIISFIFFILFIASLIKRAFEGLKKEGSISDKGMDSVILVSFAGLVLHSLSYDSLYWSMPLVMFSMLAGMLSSLSKRG